MLHRLASRLSVVVAAWLLATSSARAASLQKVDQGTWSVSGLPTYVNMYVYVPDALAPEPAILVASHHCGGSAMSTYNETRSTFVSLADKNGFIVIFPEATGHNCWDVGSSKSLKHDGGGDTHAVAQMVRYALSKYAGDPARVYAFGTSSGAMMTEALLGVYPDMFMAGVAVAGVACGCWAAEYTGDSGANPQWSGPCAGGRVSKTAEQWGGQVRAMFPGYQGHRPRVQLWHGTADTTISFKNLGEAIKEWTDVLGLSAQPSMTDSARSGYMHQVWKSGCGYVTLETWAQQGAGHGVSWDAASAASFLGLDTPQMQDPETVACPAAGGGCGSPAGAGGSGASATGSAAGPATASAAGATSSPAAGSGGVVAAGGSSSSAAAAGSTATGAAGKAVTNAAAAGASAPSGSAGPAPSVTSPQLAGAGRAATLTASAAGQPAAQGVAAPASKRDSSAGGCSVGGHAEPSGADAATLLWCTLGLLAACRRSHIGVAFRLRTVRRMRQASARSGL